MKKFFSAAAMVGLLALPALSLAQLGTPPETLPTVITSGEGIIDFLDTLANWIFSILLAVAVIFLIWAAFLWVTAGGNPENVTKARQMLINALIGVAIALVAKGLVMVVRGIMGA